MKTNFSRAAHHRLLILAAMGKGAEGADAFEKWKQLVDFTDIDYSSQRILPALTHHLSDDLVSNQIRKYIKFVWLRSQILLTAGLEAAKVLDCAGIPNLFMKGAAMLTQTEVDISKRQMSDIDIVVPIESALVATEALLTAGFTCEISEEIIKNSKEITADGHAYTFVAPNGGEVDLHWRINKNQDHFVHEKKIWERTKSVQLRSQTIKVISAEDLFLLTLLSSQDNNQANWVLDCFAIIDAKKLDWQIVYSQARLQKSSLILLEGLGILLSYKDFALPTLLKNIAKITNSLVAFGYVTRLTTLIKLIYLAFFNMFLAIKITLPVLPNKDFPAWRKKLKEESSTSGGTTYEIGQRILFGYFQGRNIRNPVATKGWHFAEPDGTWSNGELSALKIHLAHQTDNSLTLSMHFVAHLVKARMFQKIIFYVDGKRIGRKIYFGLNPLAKTVELPVAAMPNRKEINIGIRVKSPFIPLVVGSFPDPRRLGIKLLTIMINLRNPK